MRSLAAVPLALLLASSIAAQEKKPVEQVEAVLERLEEHGDSDLAADELLKLGAPAVAPIFDEMVGARGARKLAVTAAIADSPVEHVTAAIAARLDAAPLPGPDVDLQRASLIALRDVGRARDLELCLQAAEVLGEETFAPRTRELTEALDAIFERDEDLLGTIERTWLSIEMRLRTPVARSVGNRGGDGALRFLVILLERDDASAGMLLSQLGRVARDVSVSREVADHAANVARPYLRHDAQGIVKETAVLLARLGDDGAVPELIPLLAEEGEGVTGNVHWALMQITGLSFPKDEMSWASWHARERDWWARESRTVFGNLNARDPAVAGAAIREITGHRLARHTLARELTVALRHVAPAIRQDAADALARLGSNAAVPALQAALEDRVAEVGAHARAALIALTGEDPLAADASEVDAVAAMR